MSRKNEILKEKAEKKKMKGRKNIQMLDIFQITFSIVSVIERTIHEKNKRKSFQKV